MSAIKHSKIRAILRCLQVMPMVLILLRAGIAFLLLLGIVVPMNTGILSLVFGAICLRLYLLARTVKISVWSRISYLMLVIWSLIDFLNNWFWPQNIYGLVYNISIISLANGILISFLIYIYNIYERK